MVGRTRRSGDYLPNREVLGAWSSGKPVTYSNVSDSLCYDRTNKGPPYKTGGSLYIASMGLHHATSSSVYLDRTLWGSYTGRFICSGMPSNGYWGGSSLLDASNGFYSGNSGSIMSSNEDNLDAMGADGWNRAKPGKPIVDLGQFLGELRNAPSVPGLQAFRYFKGVAEGGRKSARRLSRSEAKEYLNAEFGWAPIVRDLQGLYKYQQTLAQTLAQLKRDNGKGIRRSAELRSVNENEATISQVNNLMYPYVHPFYHENGSSFRTVTHRTTRRDWFEGKFRYYIPDIDSRDWPFRAKRALLGLNPSPSLLWELLPWTWLIDWFVNIGDVLSNMSDQAAENLVADYGYVMSNVRYDYTVHEKSTVLTSTGNQVLHANSVFYKELKRRSYASPFGFGLTPDSLSGKQMAILGAVGLSRNF